MVLVLASAVLSSACCCGIEGGKACCMDVFREKGSAHNMSAAILVRGEIRAISSKKVSFFWGHPVTVPPYIVNRESFFRANEDI